MPSICLDQLLLASLISGCKVRCTAKEKDDMVIRSIRSFDPAKRCTWRAMAPVVIA